MRTCSSGPYECKEEEGIVQINDFSETGCPGGVCTSEICCQDACKGGEIEYKQCSTRPNVRARGVNFCPKDEHGNLLDENCEKEHKRALAKYSNSNDGNPFTKIKTYNFKLNENNVEKIIKDYELIIDGSDNFKTKFLINDHCLKLKKKLVTGAISKFDGHIFTFDFKDKKTASLKNFYQEKEITDDILSCEFEGVLGTTATIIGATQANEALKMLMEIGQNLKNQILIIDLLNLNFRKVKFKKR